jgi:phage shock protein PspC (stress-responsive transcriptional regulator)
MKKALQLSIAKTLFTVEEDAYALLEAYLAGVKKHFDNTDDKEEIISDIESRIAEQLLEAKEKIITAATVAKVIDSIGRVEDFDDAQNNAATQENKNGENNKQKKLYRNTDDVVIAGVCSGLAAYFNIDVVWVRIAFVALVFLTGLGILFYIILWLAMPEAKTKSQKLEMSGSPVTLETLSENVRERVEEIKKNHGNTFYQIISFLFRLMGKIVHFVAKILIPVIRTLAGTILLIASLSVLVGTMVGAGFLLSGSPSISSDIPIETLVDGPLGLFIILGAVLVIIIPALFIFFIGILLAFKKNVMTGSRALAFLGIWFIALMVSGFGVAKVMGNYESFVRTSPDYQSATLNIPLSGIFDELEIQNGLDVEITKSTTTELIATGRVKDIERISARVVEGKLVIERNNDQGFCFFCFSEEVELTLKVPALTNISARHGSSVKSNDFPSANSLALTLEHGSYGSFPLDITDLNLSVRHGSTLITQGTSSKATILAEHGSRMEGASFRVDDAIVNAAHGSIVEIEVVENLTATADHGSEIIYKGDPVLEADVNHGSDIRKIDQDNFE